MSGVGVEPVAGTARAGFGTVVGPWRNPRRGVESAKETILEVSGRPLDDQLRLEALFGYSIMGDPEIGERSKQFLESGDSDRKP